MLPGSCTNFLSKLCLFLEPCAESMMQCKTYQYVTGILSLMSGIKRLKNINRNPDALVLNDLDISKNSYYGYYYQQPYYYAGEDKPY